MFRLRFQELLKSVAEAREQSLSSEMESDTDRALVTYDAIVTHVSTLPSIAELGC